MATIEGFDGCMRALDELGINLRYALDRAGKESMIMNVEKVAKARCPVDTGRLRASIHTVSDNRTADQVTITTGTNVFYAPYVEYGHKIAHNISRQSMLTAYAKYGGGRSLSTGKVEGQYFLTTAYEMNKNNITNSVIESLERQIVEEVNKHRHIGAGARGFYSGGGY